MSPARDLTRRGPLGPAYRDPDLYPSNFSTGFRGVSSTDMLIPPRSQSPGEPGPEPGATNPGSGYVDVRQILPLLRHGRASPGQGGLAQSVHMSGEDMQILIS